MSMISTTAKSIGTVLPVDDRAVYYSTLLSTYPSNHFHFNMS